MGNLGMKSSIVLNNAGRQFADVVFEELEHRAPDETDDLEVFPVLLQSDDVRELIEAAQKRGLSATGLARRLVHQFLLRTRGVPPIGDIASTENR
jgi:hypothetical protein